MKLFSILVLLIMASSAFSQSRETTIDGDRYICRPMDDRPTSGGNNPIICADTAYRGPFTRTESARLCEGSRNDAPARCAIKAYSGPFSREESINLCIRAYSDGPAECAIKAYSGPFSRSESVELCSSPRANAGTAECALQAYRGPYSRAESVQICKGSYKSNALFNLATLSKENFEELVIRANEKAVLEGNYKK